MAEAEDISEIIKLHQLLKDQKFWGTITEHWNNGQIVSIEKRQTFKPENFDKVVIIMESS